MKLVRLLILFVVSSPCWAQAPNTPVKGASEIIGCWERIDFSDEAKKQINEIEPWPIRYQWFCFEPDGTYSSFGSSTPRTMTSATLKEMFKSLPKEFTYSVLPNGVIKTEAKSGKETLYWPSAFKGSTNTFDQKVIEKGTLIMFLVDGKKNKAVYHRYLKRLP